MYSEPFNSVKQYSMASIHRSRMVCITHALRQLRCTLVEPSDVYWDCRTRHNVHPFTEEKSVRKHHIPKEVPCQC